MVTVFISNRVHYVDNDRNPGLTVCGSKYTDIVITKDATVSCRRCLGTMCGDAIDYLDQDCRDEVIRAIRKAFKQDDYSYVI